MGAPNLDDVERLEMKYVLPLSERLQDIRERRLGRWRTECVDEQARQDWEDIDGACQVMHELISELTEAVEELSAVEIDLD